jgi:RHS repeat-associated protein
MARLVSANCGSAASQTFSYDPFGNINKSGSPTQFLPSYSASTNRMTSIAGFTPTYDSNGNVTNDSFHNYTWDADGHPTTVDSGMSDAVSLAYDALGRMVEQKRGSTYTQIVYSPGNRKLALMNGSTLQKAMVPLVGNAQAVYNSSSGPLYYAHADLLGSIRLGTTSSRTMYFDTAYAPFGETYASAGGANLDPAYTGQMADTSHRQDTAGGLYDFPMREYSIQGRWPSPDPAGSAVTCLKDPQSQNRYAYVRNNPLTRVDPDGLDGGCSDGGDGDPTCDPCVIDPASCFPGGGSGGGGGGKGGGGEKPRPFPWRLLPTDFFGLLENSGDDTKKAEGSGPCGCQWTDIKCLWRNFSGCKVDNGPEGCKETISKTPAPWVGNQCAGINPPHTFIEQWTCGGDVDCCRKKQTTFSHGCENRGHGYGTWDTPGLFGGMEGSQCCKAPPEPPKPTKK